ncbi:head-tail connector protein [Paenibacillus lactis]|uniref:head-tail connector protein n=1 Tax=Paenibacillus lactis TaxID=228574 RepID=UPI003D8147EF
MLESVKKALRISQSNTAFDEEVNDLIAAARNDLRIAGVLAAKTDDDTDPLIRRAVTVYCKANFGFDNPDAENLQSSYIMLKAHLTLSQEYTVGDA